MRPGAQLDRLLVAIALVFLALASIVIVSTPPAGGYEISIYNAYPFYFWLFITGSVCCGLIILLYHAFFEKNSKWWIAGILIVLSANSLFLLLPEFRGYALYGRYDTLTHLGYVKDILVTGHIGESNFYPIEHILAASLINIIGLSPERVPSLLSVLFSGVYVLGILLLGKVIASRSGQALLMVVFASPLIYGAFHVSINPCFLSLVTLPCLLYSYHRKQENSSGNIRHSVLLLVFAFSQTFFHPFTAFFVIVTFITFPLAEFLWTKLRKSKSFRADRVARKSVNISLIMFIAFFIWYFSFSVIQRSFKRVLDWIVYEMGTPLVEAQLEVLSKAQLTPLQTIELLVNRFGAIFLFLLTSGMSFAFSFFQCVSRKHKPSRLNFVYVIQFAVAFLIGVAMIFGYFVEYNLVRVIRFPLLIGTVINGLAIYDFVKEHTRTNNTGSRSSRRQVLLLSIAVILPIYALSLGSVYNGPRTYTANSQITQMEIVGMEWFSRSRSLDFPVIMNIGTFLRRCENYLFGVDSSPISRTKIDTRRLPSHFGYDKSPQIAEGFDFQDRYIVILRLDEVAPLFFPENVRPRVHQWTGEDFARLRSDPAWNLLYDNSEFEVSMVCGSQG